MVHIPFVDKRVVVGKNCVIPLTRAIPRRIRGDYNNALYKWRFTLLYFTCTVAHAVFPLIEAPGFY